jgi:predicted DNA-binding transcriptional regulator YafY
MDYSGHHGEKRCMDRTERLYKIDLILNEHPGVAFTDLQDRLEVSRATLKRDLAYMKDRLNAPIIFDRDMGGYRFDRDVKQVGDQYELPGLWFSAEEIHALLTMQHLLVNLDTGGMLGPHIKPLLSRLTALLGTADNAAEESSAESASRPWVRASSIWTTFRQSGRRCCGANAC